MKWITHETAAIGAAFFLGMSSDAMAGVALGSILPDMIDQKISSCFGKNSQAVFYRIHRGTTHWFGWWLGLYLLCLFKGSTIISSETIQFFLVGVGFGALGHVILDMCTITGVPITPWSRKKRIALKLCKTGGIREYIFLIALISAFIFFSKNELSPIITKVERHLRSLI